MRLGLLLPASLIALAGCGDRTLDPNPDGMTVTATLSAVTLAYDCPSAGAPAEPRSADAPGACPDGQACRALCQQSNLQLALGASGEGSARVEVVRVRILDEESGALLDEIEARDPQRWSPPRYEAWDEQLTAPSSLTASYKLSAPDWRKIEGAANLSGSRAVYRVEVELRIGGLPRTVRLDGVSREPEVAT